MASKTHIRFRKSSLSAVPNCVLFNGFDSSTYELISIQPSDVGSLRCTIFTFYVRIKPSEGEIMAIPEQVRLQEARNGKADWRKWGPYLSERQWGTVREDDSDDGTLGATFHTTRHGLAPTDGLRTGWTAFLMTSNDSALHWLCGTSAIPFLKSAYSDSPTTRAIMVRM